MELECCNVLFYASVFVGSAMHTHEHGYQNCLLNRRIGRFYDCATLPRAKSFANSVRRRFVPQSVNAVQNRQNRDFTGDFASPPLCQNAVVFVKEERETKRVLVRGSPSRFH